MQTHLAISSLQEPAICAGFLGGGVTNGLLHWVLTDLAMAESGLEPLTGLPPDDNAPSPADALPSGGPLV